MAGTEIRIADNGMFMIHDPWGMTIGTSLAVIFVPVFFLIVRTLFRGKQEREHDREVELEENDSHGQQSGPKEVMIP